MKIKGLIDEDFINYKLPSMFIATARCTGKCNIDNGQAICQNIGMKNDPDIDIPDHKIVERYKNNLITKAIVFGGLDPIDQYEELRKLIKCFRDNDVSDDIVIYTGYTKDELSRVSMPTGMLFDVDYVNLISELADYGNIIIKFGRYIPNQQPHFDDVLGIYLASDNQYAERISHD